MALAFIAPGQGAQFVGMGLELTKSYPKSRSVYEEVDDALGEKLSAVSYTHLTLPTT